MPTRPKNVSDHDHGDAAESPAKKLRQERATLGSRQGDPESPGNGTMYARRKRLSAELEQIQSRQGARQTVSSRNQFEGSANALSRPLHIVQRDLRLVDEEISATQQRIDEIDQLLATVEGKNRH